MFFPEFLYQLSGRDQQVSWLDPVAFFIQDAQLATTVSVLFTVPTESVLVLQHAFAQYSPAGAQTANIKKLELLPPVTTVPELRLDEDRVTGGAGVTQKLSWQGSIIVPATWRVRAHSTFSAAGVANTVNLTILGILLPIGNIQRV